MRMTDHARKRWAQRFPDLDPEEEYLRARRTTKRQRTQIRKQAPIASKKHYPSEGLYYLYTRRSNIVWAMAAKEIVITVFPFHENTSWARVARGHQAKQARKEQLATEHDRNRTQTSTPTRETRRSCSPFPELPMPEISGYRSLSDEEIAVMNGLKALEQQVLEHIKALRADPQFNNH